MESRVQDSTSLRVYNAATHTVASSLGVLLGVSSISHSVLEMMQGNLPTPGSFVKALGPGYSWTLWVHGSEPAFTLVHNFLLTGMLATTMGILLIAWSACFIARRGGATVFLLISIASFLTGSGQAQALLFTLNWATATRIHVPLRFWQRIIPAPLRRVLARVWGAALVSAGALFLAALEIATFGYFPGFPRDTQSLTRILWRLAAAIIAMVSLAIMAGFAHDLEARSTVHQFSSTSSHKSAVHRG